MPTHAGLSHLSFSVSDAEKSARWWKEVFGLREFTRLDDEDGWHAILLWLTPTFPIEFQEHTANRGETFDPTRTGLDHLGLAVDSREDLFEWQAHFEAHGVEYTPVVDREYGAVLTFKDPDRIQFEMFYAADN